MLLGVICVYVVCILEGNAVFKLKCPLSKHFFSVFIPRVCFCTSERELLFLF